ncbi:MAG: hypothetical protein ACREJU_09780 [Nitrospiraceae bacterium]
MMLLLHGCSAKSTTSPSGMPRAAKSGVASGPPIKLSYDFSKGMLGWEADFSDYAITQTDMQFVAELRPLPLELKTNATGYFLQGNNRHNYDLFMFLKRRLGPAEGIKENQTYRVIFRLTFASNAGSHCLSVIGAPGESVFLKAGASSTMPLAFLKEGRYRLNVDKGEVNMGGREASLVGNIANGLRCKDFPSAFQVPYVSLKRVHKHPAPVRANSKGELWLLVGSDSAYESITGVYYQQIEVELTPVRAAVHPRFIES